MDLHEMSHVRCHVVLLCRDGSQPKEGDGGRSRAEPGCRSCRAATGAHHPDPEWGRQIERRQISHRLADQHQLVPFSPAQPAGGEVLVSPRRFPWHQLMVKKGAQQLPEVIANCATLGARHDAACVKARRRSSRPR